MGGRAAARWEDAFLSGNGRHGALVFGGPGDERVVVTHHCLVTPVPPADTLPPRLADRLPDLQDRLLAGDTAAADAFTDGRGLRWVGAFHPAFAIRVRQEAADAAGYRREVDFATGVVRARCRGRDSRVFVSRADDVVVRYLAGAPIRASVALDHRLPGVPPGLGVGRGTALTAEGRCCPCAPATPAARRRSPVSRSPRSPAARWPWRATGCGWRGPARCCC